MFNAAQVAHRGYGAGASMEARVLLMRREDMLELLRDLSNLIFRLEAEQGMVSKMIDVLVLWNEVNEEFIDDEERRDIMWVLFSSFFSCSFRSSSSRQRKGRRKLQAASRAC